MSFDIEMFLKDKIEEILKLNPDYDNIRIEVTLKIDGGKVTIKPYVDAY